MEEFGLALHPEKTRLIEFGCYAASRRKERGLKGSPETINFLGFTHICSVKKWKSFKLMRITIGKRMKSKLKSFKDALRKRMNMDDGEVAKWLKRGVRGYYKYFAIPGNQRSLSAFSYWLGRIWYRTICRRWQKRRMTWEKFIKRCEGRSMRIRFCTRILA
jgi:hypothetical protein